MMGRWWLGRMVAFTDLALPEFSLGRDAYHPHQRRAGLTVHEVYGRGLGIVNILKSSGGAIKHLPITGRIGYDPCQ